jgi:hypothetical protein
VYETCTTEWSKFSTAVRVLSTRIPPKIIFVFLSYCINRLSVCLSVWLLYQFRDTSWKKEKDTGIHILQQWKREKPTQTNHTKLENSPIEKKFLLRMAVSRWQNRYSEEYEAHVHILQTNNFVQVSQASRGWAESGKSVRSARMTYLPPLFQLSPSGTGSFTFKFWHNLYVKCE